MSIIVKHKSGLTVNTIDDRDKIEFKTDGMEVWVRDAGADPIVGKGKALYRFDKPLSKWILISKEINEKQEFVFETNAINSDGEVILNNKPVIDILWDIKIKDSDGNIIKKLNSVNISSNKITGLKDYSGKLLECVYAIGDVTSSLDKILSSIKNKVVELDDRVKKMESLLTDASTVDLNDDN